MAFPLGSTRRVSKQPVNSPAGREMHLRADRLQERMSFVDDREDINSMCLTAVQRLLETYGECGAPPRTGSDSPGATTRSTLSLAAHSLGGRVT